MEMKEVEITYENLFSLIAKEENIEYELNEEYFQSTPIEIFNESNEWISVNGLIKKEAKSIEIELDHNINIVCAKNHLVHDGTNLKYATHYKIGDKICTPNMGCYTITKITEINNPIEVYDLEVNSESHLYQCSLGIIHHNTLLTAAIIKYANMLNMKTITIVPSSSLLKQTHDYIEQFDMPVGMFGAGKKDDSINIVATWQTLQNNKAFIRDFECIIWDEVHGAKAFVAQQIMQEARKSFMRIGLTGTIPKDALDKANLTAGFGPVTYDVKAHDLQSRDILSSIHISIFKLLYPKEYINSFVDWHDETTFLQTNEMYIVFMKALLDSLEGNTLILMKNVDPASELSELLGCEFISSKLSIKKRQDKFDEFIYGADHTATGTYSLLSTGIDIVHINNLILGPTPGKSFTKVIQSIGRGLRRKSGQKEHVNVIDLTSNLKFDKKHIKARKDYYVEAQYPFEFDEMDVSQFILDVKPK